MFNGAAIAFFSFIGFDAVATAAEEVVDPARVMPLGILASLSTVTVIYVLMCVVLCLMVPRAAIDTKATFAAAFEYVGLPWAKYIVALGALMGECIMLYGYAVRCHARACCCRTNAVRRARRACLASRDTGHALRLLPHCVTMKGLAPRPQRPSYQTTPTRAYLLSYCFLLCMLLQAS